jgi:hypothetical protein
MDTHVVTPTNVFRPAQYLVLDAINDDNCDVVKFEVAEIIRKKLNDMLGSRMTDRKLAIAMGLHDTIGEKSTIFLLPSHILEKIAVEATLHEVKRTDRYVPDVGPRFNFFYHLKFRLDLPADEIMEDTVFMKVTDPKGLNRVIDSFEPLWFERCEKILDDRDNHDDSLVRRCDSTIQDSRSIQACDDHSHPDQTNSLRHLEECIVSKLMHPDNLCPNGQWVSAGMHIGAYPMGIIPRGRPYTGCACPWFVMHYYTNDTEYGQNDPPSEPRMYDHIVWVASYLYNKERVLVFRDSMPFSPWLTESFVATEPIFVQFDADFRNSVMVERHRRDNEEISYNHYKLIKTNKNHKGYSENVLQEAIKYNNFKNCLDKW